MLQAWRDSKMPAYGFIIIGCWLIFIGYWIVSAFSSKATMERGSFASTLLYRIPLIIGGILIWTFHVWHPPMTMPITPESEATRWAGAFVCVAGLAIAIWARGTLGSNWSSNVQFKEGHQLIRKGPYRFARHPIYTGILVMCSAQGIQFGRLHFWLGFVIIGIGLWIKLKQEETVMLKYFSEYAEYRKQVRALVPFVL
jgi:protein-S-isoprenylcysteine O-methyltransferase Ste14